MALSYRYRAMDERGRLVRGTLDAINPVDLELRLANMGLDLVNFRGTGVGLLQRRSRRVSRKELVSFSFHLEQLIRAGVPLTDALRDLRASVLQPGFRAVIAEVVQNIEGGQTFSDAIRPYADVFGPVYGPMVRVGEETGQLAKVLHELAEMLLWQDALAAKARRVIIYPALVAAVLCAVVAVLMLVLVPQLSGFLRSSGQQMPEHTRWLIATAQALREHWWLVPAALAGAPLAVGLLAKISAGFRYWLDRLKLGLWLSGPILLRIKLARFAHNFALMYSTGISVLDAIQLCRGLMDNRVLEQALADVYTQISEGGGISASFAQSGLFPPLVVRMMRVGETSGAMDQALLNVSRFYGREVDEAIDRIEPVAGPVLIAVLGGLVFWIILAVLGPIYDAVLTLGRL